METQKSILLPEELQKLNKFQADINQNIYELGQIRVQKYNLERQIEMSENDEKNVLKLLETLTRTEQEFLKELETKYGNGSIDLSTGKIT